MIVPSDDDHIMVRLLLSDIAVCLCHTVVKRRLAVRILKRAEDCALYAAVLKYRFLDLIQILTFDHLRLLHMLNRL